MNFGESGTRGDEDGCESELAEQLVDRHRLADDDVGLEVDSEGAQALDVLVDERLRQPELRDAVAKDAADRMERLEHGHAVAELREVARRGEAGRAGADDRDPLRALGNDLGCAVPRVHAVPVGDEALEPADPDGLEAAEHRTFGLALVLDRADTAADRRKGIACADQVDAPEKSSDRDARG